MTTVFATFPHCKQTPYQELYFKIFEDFALFNTQMSLNLLAGVLNLARSAGPELLLKDDASKPLLEKLLKG